MSHQHAVIPRETQIPFEGPVRPAHLELQLIRDATVVGIPHVVLERPRARRIEIGWLVDFKHGREAAAMVWFEGDRVRATGLASKAVPLEVAQRFFGQLPRPNDRDVLFIRRDRIPAPTPRGFWKGPADLAIEVLSPEDRQSEVRAKVDEYLRRGTPVVMVVDPDKRTVTTFRSTSEPTSLGENDTLDLDDVIAGFSCDVRAIFD